MWAFIVAILVFIGFIFFAFLIGSADAMADAPRADKTPLVVFIAGIAISLLIASTHWLSHWGW